MTRFVRFPGRHHLLTRFQAQYLQDLNGTVVWAFCGLEFADWKALLTDVGFEIDAASRAWRNDWIVEHRMRPVAELSTVDGEPIDWPVTHVLLVARRPLNT